MTRNRLTRLQVAFPYFTIARELHAPYGLVLAYAAMQAGRPSRKWEQEK